MNVEIDRDVCIASGACQVECPDVFGGDDDGFAVVLSPEPEAALHERVHTAAEFCPTGAILVDE